MTAPLAIPRATTGKQHALNQLLQWLAQQDYQFATVSPHSHQAYLARRQAGEAQQLTDIFGWSLPFSATLLPQALFEALQHAGLLQPGGVNATQQPLWRSTFRVAHLAQCLFVHSAYPTSHEDSVFFGPDTYRFIYALKQYLLLWHAQQRPLHRALELCSGAGPAAIVAAQHAPGAEVTATDINPQALELVGINAQFNQVDSIRVVHSDLFAALEGDFDLIMANPPYLIDGAKRLYRHGGGLLGAALALRIVQQALGHLALDGRLLIYTGVVIANGQDLFKQHVEQHVQREQGNRRFTMHYATMDSDIFAEELADGNYPDAERIAAVILLIERVA